MRRELLSDNAATTLASAVSNSQTTLVVASAASFPATGDFRLIVEKEIMLCTGVSGVTLTVTRGVDGTTAVAHDSGKDVVHILTQSGIQTFLRDNIPMVDLSPPFRLVDSSGAFLTPDSFGTVNVGATPIVKMVGNALTLSRHGTSGSTYGTFLTRPMPTTPAALVTCVSGTALFSAGSNYVGVGVRCSTTGVTLVLMYNPYHPQIALQTYSTPTNNTGTQVGFNWTAFNPRAWIRVLNTGQTIGFSLSHDGVNWMFYTSQQIASIFSSNPPDQFVFYTLSNSVYCSTGNILAWDEGTITTEPGLLSWYRLDDYPVDGFVMDFGPAKLNMQIFGAASGNQLIHPTAASDVPTQLPYTYSLSLTGSGDWGSGPYDNSLWPLGGTPRSFSVWFKSNSATPGDSAIIGYGVINNGQQLVFGISTNSLWCDFGWNGTGMAVSSFPGLNWHHLVFVVSNSTTFKWYLDGVYLGTSGPSAGGIGTASSYLKLSQQLNGGGGSQNFNGKLSDLRVYNRELTLTEISRLYAGLNADGSSIVL